MGVYRGVWASFTARTLAGLAVPAPFHTLSTAGLGGPPPEPPRRRAPSGPRPRDRRDHLCVSPQKIFSGGGILLLQSRWSDPRPACGPRSRPSPELEELITVAARKRDHAADVLGKVMLIEALRVKGWLIL